MVKTGLLVLTSWLDVPIRLAVLVVVPTLLVVEPAEYDIEVRLFVAMLCRLSYCHGWKIEDSRR